MGNGLLEVWRLAFIDRTGTRLAINGKHEILEAACDEWENAKTSCDGTGAKVITVEGITDTADRAPMTIRVVVEDIVATVLNRMT